MHLVKQKIPHLENVKATHAPSTMNEQNMDLEAK